MVARLVLGYLGLCAVVFPMLWVVYLGIMALDRQRHAGPVTLPDGYVIPAGLSRAAQIAGGVLLLFGYLLDALSNVLLTGPFLDLPREPLVTERLTRYVDGAPSWRRKVALWVRVNLLDGFDRAGIHRS